MVSQKKKTSEFECQVPEVYSLPANRIGIEKDHTYNMRCQHASSLKPHSSSHHTVPFDDSFSFIDNSVIDPDYSVEDDDLEQSKYSCENSTTSITKERKFVVFESKLDELFKLARCLICGRARKEQKKQALGTSLHNQLICTKITSLLVGKVSR